MIAVVIPSYRVTKHIIGVINRIGDEVSLIVVVDDKCPDGSGELVEKTCSDDRVKVIYHERNKGVGGAVMSGYRYALEKGADVIVKLDGDGQMAPELIPELTNPINSGIADYCKGNRFYSLYNVRKMPRVRLFGNAILSFITKLSSGYWRVFDPTNGFTAIHGSALKKLEMKNISERYFFETDMLINLGGIGAVVIDMPMEAVYGDEESGLSVRKVMLEFFVSNIKAFFKRIIYYYFVRDFNVASVQLIFGLIFFTFGLCFGFVNWAAYSSSGVAAPVGTVMIAVLTIILGFQLFLSFITYDVSNDPKIPIQAFSKR